MKLKIEKDKGWSEAILDDNCGYDKFYKTAGVIESAFRTRFIKKVDGFDSLYWDFKYHNVPLTLHYNVYLGVSLFPTYCKDASAAENVKAEEFGQQLFTKLLDEDWKNVDKGRTIGRSGHEGGNVIIDVENIHGARITVEELHGDHPRFVITFGIYGLLFHTHSKTTYDLAGEYIAWLKYKINKVFDMYELPEKHRDDSWYHQHDTLVHELTID